jgi:hypothetical protein
MERFLVSIGAGLAIFASFPASSNYHLNSYSIGPMGTSNSHSTTYYTQSTGGEVSGNPTASTNYKNTSGVVQTEALALPQAPTVTNGSSTYYNRLLVTLNDNAGTSSYPSDVTFSVGISTTNCFTSACISGGGVQFVQTGGTLSTSQFYQTYSAWGSTSGTTVVGLTASTTYYVAVAAKQGTFTNTGYGLVTTTATVAPSVTFSLSANSLAIGSLLPSSVITSGSLSLGLATNAVYGANIYTTGQYGGLHSTTHGNTIGAPSGGNLATSTDGFGIQDQSVGQTSGGPMAKVSPYNGSANIVGTPSSTYAPIFSTSGPTVGGTGTFDAQAKSSGTDPASTDYQEILTFIAAASY